MKLVMHLTNGNLVAIRYATYVSPSASGNYLSVEFEDDVHPAYASKIACDLGATLSQSEDGRFCTFFLPSDVKCDSLGIFQ